MVNKEEARKLVESRLSENLTIVSSWENEYDFVFALGFVDEDGTARPIVGDNTVRISKENGEMR